jgi:hypothetical protein
MHFTAFWAIWIMDGLDGGLWMAFFALMHLIVSITCALNTADVESSFVF